MLHFLKIPVFQVPEQLSPRFVNLSGSVVQSAGILLHILLTLSEIITMREPVTRCNHGVTDPAGGLSILLYLPGFGLHLSGEGAGGFGVLPSRSQVFDEPASGHDLKLGGRLYCCPAFFVCVHYAAFLPCGGRLSLL